MQLTVVQLKPTPLDVTVKGNDVVVVAQRPSTGGSSAVLSVNTQIGDVVITAAGLGAEVSSNKVTSFSSPTDVQYPSAKLVNDTLNTIIGNVNTALSAKADLVGGVVPTSQLPPLAIIAFLGTVASQAAMLALSGQQGDWCIRSDLHQVFIIIGSDPTQLSNWQALDYPIAPVTSVNGQTGTVVLGKSDVGLSNVDNTSDANKPVSSATQTALNLKVNTSTTVNGHALSGNVTVTATDLALPYARRYEQSGNYQYCGTAPLGSATSASVWTVRRLVYSGGAYVSTGTATPIKWDDRATATYS